MRCSIRVLRPRATKVPAAMASKRISVRRKRAQNYEGDKMYLTDKDHPRLRSSEFVVLIEY